MVVVVEVVVVMVVVVVVLVCHPCDSYPQADQKTGDHPTPDQEVFRALASSYAESNPGMTG